MRFLQIWFATMVSVTIAAPMANEMLDVSPLDSRDDNSVSGFSRRRYTPTFSARQEPPEDDPWKAIDTQKICEDCNCRLNAFFLPLPGPGRCPAGKCHKCSGYSLSKGLQSTVDNMLV
ncbi:uncharacterized protein FFB20_02656 [Fusarium fujikuroi]|nr:uncharacterized protein FFB20_02656 [Fusarium fujikuroi]SCN86118.1 uncharacterized protein FFC1_05062 [Fusarium fujikuroi]SCO23633.1 uncharacterized protein FFE2_15697 [Fusarium fujikuroi]SCO33762.1 uncharacterized protein FFNC_03424 [Fusarium fujikuroi]SCV36206.1 uncharacterized protein FFB14_05970 [Fusarium fujikuroi]